jgi:hypothetical protein
MYETDTERYVKILLKYSMCLIQHHTIKIWETGTIYAHILNLSTRWRWVVTVVP